MKRKSSKRRKSKKLVRKSLYLELPSWAKKAVKRASSKKKKRY